MPLRYYQEHACEALEFSWSEFRSSIIRIGTGGGKTRTGCEIIKRNSPKRVMWMADQDELCAQPLRAIARDAGVIPALEKGSIRASRRAQVVVASAQTISRKKNLESWPRDHFDIVVIDEAHRGAPRNSTVADHFENAKILGFTATPFRVDMSDLSKWYEDVAYSLPLCDKDGGNQGLVEQGFAPPIKVISVPVEIDLGGIEIKRTPGGEKDFDQEQLGEKLEPYFDEILDGIFKHAKGKHILVFLPLIHHSLKFLERARLKGFTAKHVDGKSPNREEILEEFSEGRFEMLCNAGVISTGVDIPIADVFVNLKVTRSRSWYEQAFGRVGRVLPGVIDDIPGEDQAEERKRRIADSDKPFATVLDFLFLHDELCMHAGHLVASNEEDARAIFELSKKSKSEEDLAGIAQDVQKKRQEALIKRLEYASREIKGKSFTPETMALLTGDKEILSYDAVKKWELGSPTQKQLDALAKFGIESRAVVNIGMASFLMDKLHSRISQGMATLPQLRFLHNLGLTDYQDLTISEASKIIDATKRP